MVSRNVCITNIPEFRTGKCYKYTLMVACSITPSVRTDYSQVNIAICEF